MPCEILTLDIGDLDRPGKRARVISKGGDTDWVYYQTGTALLLPRLLAGRTRGPVFLAERAPTPGGAHPGPVPRHRPGPTVLPPRGRTVRTRHHTPRGRRRAADRVVPAPAAPLCTDPRRRERHQHPDAARAVPTRLHALPRALRPTRPRSPRPPRRSHRPRRPTTTRPLETHPAAEPTARHPLPPPICPALQPTQQRGVDPALRTRRTGHRPSPDRGRRHERHYRAVPPR